MVESVNEVQWNADAVSVDNVKAFLQAKADRLAHLLASTAQTSAEIIVACALVIKKCREDADFREEFLKLAEARKVTVPKDLDKSAFTTKDGNIALFVVRVLVGEFVNGKWVYSVYAAKNFPNAVRYCAEKLAEDTFDTLLNSLKETKTTIGGKGKKVSGIEAAKALDRAEHGKPRKVVRKRTDIPREVDRVSSSVSFKAEPDLFPVDEDGYGIAVIRFVDGKFQVLFGSAEEAEIADLVEAGYEEHKDRLGKIVKQRSVPIDKVAGTHVEAAH